MKTLKKDIILKESSLEKEKKKKIVSVFPAMNVLSIKLLKVNLNVSFAIIWTYTKNVKNFISILIRKKYLKTI